MGKLNKKLKIIKNLAKDKSNHLANWIKNVWKLIKQKKPCAKYKSSELNCKCVVAESSSLRAQIHFHYLAETEWDQFIGEENMDVVGEAQTVQTRVALSGKRGKIELGRMEENWLEGRG